MTMASGFFGITLEDALDATALDPNLDGDTVTLALVTDTYTPNFNTHDQYADVTNEVSGTGYSAGGNNLDSQTWATSGGAVTYDTADEAWTSSTFSSVRGGVGYDNTLTGDPLLWTATAGADYSVTSGTFTYQVAAAGHFYFDIAP